MIKKTILSFSDFYLAEFTLKNNAPYLLFIHGGPGSNSSILEYFVENEKFFSTLNYNIITYDQRGCGRSKNDSSLVSHESNISDLIEIYQYLNSKFPLSGFVGHSYGAKLLFDFRQQYTLTHPSVFISVSESLMTPRINNLLLDLNYLKRTDRDAYEKIQAKITDFNSHEIWHITEKLAPLFAKNPDRLFFYWANLDILNRVQTCSSNLPVNTDVFMSVRKNLYLEKSDILLDFSTMQTPFLWINGAQDLIINGGTQKSTATTLFYKSAHYPHLEENEHFCDTVNTFFENAGKFYE